ncbi:MAG: hypothetical protein AAFU03_16225, partial [Bacteroidota bacterium]
MKNPGWNFVMRLLLISIVAMGYGVFLGAQPSNASCITAITIPTTFQECGSSVTEALVGDNIGDIVTENSAEFSMCAPNNGTTAATFQDVWYRFVATNNTTEIRLTTPDMAGLNVVLYEGNCLDLTAIRCGVGTDEVEVVVNTEPGLQYFIRVSGIDENDEGNFNLSFTYFEDCDPCFSADHGQLVVNPIANTAGFYVCGSTVNMCFTLTDWVQTGSNEWIHSVVPEFGPGWDLSTLMIT